MWAWLLVSALMLAVLLAPWMLPESALLHGSGACSLPHAEPCPLCGMTRAFLAIGRGDFAGALAHNRGSVALWGAMLTNVLLAAACLVRRGLPASLPTTANDRHLQREEIES